MIEINFKKILGEGWSPPLFFVSLGMEKNNKVTSSIKKLIHPTTQTPFLFVNKSQFAIQHTSVMSNEIFHTLHVFGTPLTTIQFDPTKPAFVVIRNPQEFLKTLPQDFIDQYQLYI